MNPRDGYGKFGLSWSKPLQEFCTATGTLGRDCVLLPIGGNEFCFERRQGFQITGFSHQFLTRLAKIT